MPSLDCFLHSYGRFKTLLSVSICLSLALRRCAGTAPRHGRVSGNLLRRHLNLVIREADRVTARWLTKRCLRGQICPISSTIYHSDADRSHLISSSTSASPFYTCTFQGITIIFSNQTFLFFFVLFFYHTLSTGSSFWVMPQDDIGVCLFTLNSVPRRVKNIFRNISFQIWFQSHGKKSSVLL